MLPTLLRMFPAFFRLHSRLSRNSRGKALALTRVPPSPRNASKNDDWSHPRGALRWAPAAGVQRMDRRQVRARWELPQLDLE
jgi:hypothetical protein